MNATACHEYVGDHPTVGQHEIDRQHASMYRLIVEYSDTLKNRSSTITLHTVERLLQELEDFSKMHFEFEMLFMKIHNYPYILEHHDVHLHFVVALQKFSTWFTNVHMSPGRMIDDILQFRTLVVHRSHSQG